MSYIPSRPRRNRANPAVRGLIKETHLTAGNLILPLFVQEGENVDTPIQGKNKLLKYHLA